MKNAVLEGAAFFLWGYGSTEVAVGEDAVVRGVFP